MGNSSMPEEVPVEQGLTGPVPVGESEYKSGEAFDEREKCEGGEQTDEPRPRPEGNEQLRDRDRDNHQCLPHPSLSAKRAMFPVSHMNVAGHIGAGPERMASAFENPRTQIDKKKTVDGKRQGEGRPFREHGRQHWGVPADVPTVE